MRILVIAAAAVLVTGAAYAQSGAGAQNPSVPGSGYQAPAAGAAGTGQMSGAGVADPSKPGSGYQVAPGQPPQASPTPQGAGVADPARPGSGYGGGDKR